MQEKNEISLQSTLRLNEPNEREWEEKYQLLGFLVWEMEWKVGKGDWAK